MKNEIKKLAEEIYRAGVALDGSDFAHKSDHFERLAGKLYKAGYRKQSETITFYKDPNIKDWAESEYAWCERPCDSNMSMRAIDKEGNIVGYASEHYWTWCDVKEVKKVSAIEFMRHFASKRSEVVC